MHGFCDVLEQAFAAVVHLGSAYEDGTVEVELVAFKTRVTSLKKQTISQLELLGAVILSCLMSNVTDCLSESISKFYWTDPMATIHWI